MAHPYLPQPKSRPRILDRLADRFWAKVAKALPDQCWEWQAAKNKVNGYGVMGTAHHQTDTAHRISWELAYGPIPAQLSVLHHWGIIYLSAKHD